MDSTDLSVPTAIKQNFALSAATVARPSIVSSILTLPLRSTTDFLTPLAHPLSLNSSLLAPYALSSIWSLDGLASISGDLSP